MSPSGTVAGCHLQHLFTWQLCPGRDVQCCSPVSYHVLSCHCLDWDGMGLWQKGNASGNGAGNTALSHGRHELRGLMEQQCHKIMAMDSDTPVKLPVGFCVVPDSGVCFCLCSLGVPIGRGSPTST